MSVMRLTISHPASEELRTLRPDGTVFEAGLKNRKKSEQQQLGADA